MADFFKEILTDIDKLSDEQVNQLMAALEVKRAGGQTTKDSIKENDEIPLACPHCGSISLKRHGKADRDTVARIVVKLSVKPVRH